MSEYYIATDATFDLNQELTDELGVKVIPMEFLLDGVSYYHYPDCHELSLPDFYRGLKEGKSASTTQITPNRYMEFFEELLADGKDIIYIALSSGLSGTYASACLAAVELCDKYPDRKIRCIDSVCASIGEGLLVYNAALQQKKGLSYDEMVDYIEETKVKCCHWFMVEDLEQLKRGGRINALEAVLGAALNIHPILSTDRQGKLRVVTKVRSAKKALSYILQTMINDGVNLAEQTVMVGHGNAEEYAKALQAEVLATGLVKDCIIAEIGPVIGSHVGSGMCALVFLGDNYKGI